MSVWAQLDDVRRLVTYAELDESSDPSQDDVQIWLDEAEAHTRNALRASGLPVQFTAGSDAFLHLTRHIAQGVAGMVRQAWATSRGDDDGGGDGSIAVAKFEERIESIASNPTLWGAMLDEGGAAPTRARRVRSHTTTGGETSSPIYSLNKRDRAF